MQVYHLGRCMTGSISASKVRFHGENRVLSNRDECIHSRDSEELGLDDPLGSVPPPDSGDLAWTRPCGVSDGDATRIPDRIA